MSRCGTPVSINRPGLNLGTRSVELTAGTSCSGSQPSSSCSALFPILQFAGYSQLWLNKLFIDIR